MYTFGRDEHAAVTLWLYHRDPVKLQLSCGIAACVEEENSRIEVSRSDTRYNRGDESLHTAVICLKLILLHFRFNCIPSVLWCCRLVIPHVKPKSLLQLQQRFH